jgi:hypothetical protein
MRSRLRQKLPAISEQMKVWCGALAQEVSDWPQVRARSFFGYTGLYRTDFMFAVLPRTRSLETANALAFRLDDPAPSLRSRLEKDPRIGSAEIKRARWFSLELSADSDLHDALRWLRAGYDAAGKGRKSS